MVQRFLARHFSTRSRERYSGKLLLLGEVGSSVDDSRVAVFIIFVRVEVISVGVIKYIFRDVFKDVRELFSVCFAGVRVGYFFFDG